MRRLLCTLAVVAMLCTVAAPSFAETNTGFFFDAPGNGQHKLALGARYHDKASSVSGRALDKGDLSWLLAYEYHEEFAFWQIVLGYASNGQIDADARVITPELNLIFKDGIYRLGIGALANRVTPTDGDSDWTDLHWQVIMGVSVPVFSKLSIDLYGYYLFSEFDEIAETSDNALELSLLASFAF